MRWIAFLLTAILLWSCNMKRTDQIPYSEKEQLADQILARAAFKLREEKGLILCGTGGGMLDQVRMLALSFDYPDEVTIQEGRKLLIAAVQTLLAEINANELIRPYLQNYPFESTNIEIRIFLKNPEPPNFEENSLHVLSVIDGIFNYYTKIPEKKFGRFKKIYKETYTEALQELEQS